MLLKRNTTLVAASLTLVTGLLASMQQPKDRNLQVLPQDISDARLDSLMETYNKALGVQCNFCHVPYDKKVPDSLDYASDTEPMKTEARKMMEMTIHLNKTYFWYDSTRPPYLLNAVRCKTCHQGEPFPPED